MFVKKAYHIKFSGLQYGGIPLQFVVVEVFPDQIVYYIQAVKATQIKLKLLQKQVDRLESSTFSV